jgi:hypothetical protein
MEDLLMLKLVFRSPSLRAAALALALAALAACGATPQTGGQAATPAAPAATAAPTTEAYPSPAPAPTFDAYPSPAPAPTFDPYPSPAPGGQAPTAAPAGTPSTGGSVALPQGINPGPIPPERVAAALGDLQQRAGVAAGAITVVSAEAVEWSDGSLGCPQPDMMYPQVISPGYRLILAAGGQEYAYHGNESGDLFFCANPSLPVGTSS